MAANVTGQPPAAARATLEMSPRIAKAIAETEAAAEKIVTLLQLAGIGGFLALYAATRGAFSASSHFEPVPIVLAVYGGFLALRWLAARRNLFNRWRAYVYAVLDASMLMVLIWSFTLQYQAPATLYLKAPTLFYVFILIALRALRFNPWVVLLTGATAAIGWTILVLIAAAQAGPGALTNDYRVYMTALAVLPGAEAEKLAAIVLVTGILAWAVARARDLLVRTNVEAAAAHNLSRFLDPGAAARVRDSVADLRPGDGEIKPAAILFLDLRGFSAACADLPGAGVIALLQDYQSRFVPILEAAGGSIDKYLGDGILVSFGTARATGREAADAAAVIPALLESAADWRRQRAAQGLPPLDLCIAFDHGNVVHGVVGHGDRLEFTVIGDAVNVAAKLEKHAKVEGARAIATFSAIAAARAQGWTGAGSRTVTAAKVEGISEPIDLVILEAIGG